ncbi:hypothetical protein FACS1894130_02820 [Spirochaetia bacterium]|nr:hypothetical protein FACS1894130_02820 [Spirochaetia bacterium]
MKNRRTIHHPGILMVLITLLLAGCAGLVEKGGHVLDGSAFATKTLAVFEDKNAGPDHKGIRVSQILEKKGNREIIVITVNAFPTLRLNGSAPLWNGRFTLESLEFLSPNLTGWNEFSRELSGEGLFWVNGLSATFTLAAVPEVLDIGAGKIRRNTTRITGDQALTALRNREERVYAITSWMKEWLEANDPGRSSFIDLKEFEGYWKPILFPETLSAKKRPAPWKAFGADGPNRANRDEWTRGEDISWSKTYTAALFPEEIRPIRDSGTLLRDWEEASAWIYYQFAWDYIMESLTSETHLSKIK